MKFYIFIFITALLVSMFQSCGVITDDTKPACCTRPSQPSDPAFEIYVKEFEYYSRVNTRAVPIYFADLKDGIAGVCHYFRIGGGPIRWGYIEIDKQYWQVTSELQKVNLIFHELGHCVLGLDHVEWKTPNECPSSFMYQAVLNNYCLEKYYDDYLQEMFPQ